MTTDLESRRLPNGVRVSQGAREYFEDIVNEMLDRKKGGAADRMLARELRKALPEGKLDNIVVKGYSVGIKVDGVVQAAHGGYDVWKFDIRPKGTKK